MLYGTLQSEQVAIENLQCRKIVRDIADANINQRQMWYLLYLLALELEDVERMQDLTAIIKEMKPEAFLSGDQNG